MAEFSLENAKKLLEEGVGEAQELLGDKDKINDLLAQVEEKIASIPYVGEDLANVPTMISLVKSYVTKEYTEISPKVVASVVASLLYLVKKKDLIPDNIPVLGQVDDIAVITVAMKLCSNELNEYKAWKEAKEA